MGRAFIFENMAPFGFAFFTVMLSRERGKLAAFVSVLAGMLSVQVGAFIFKYVAAMGLLFLIYNMLERPELQEVNSFSIYDNNCLKLG